MDKTVEKMSRYAAALQYSDITPAALHAAKRSLIDSVGCAMGALEAAPVKLTRRLASRTQSSTPASVFGSSIKTSPEMAAFVNGVMLRYLDFSDDYINHDGPHPSDTIPAVMAACESAKAGGKALARGIVLAYEMVDRLVDSANFKSTGWDYVTETSIGSAMGAGSVFGLSKGPMAHALALAIAPNIALRQTRANTELTMWKGCAGPNAARNGLFAALLASEGMEGPNQIIEGRHGLWNKVTGHFELDAFGGQGRPFKIEETFIKSLPVQYPCIVAVEAAMALHQEVDLQDIHAVRIWFDQFAHTSTGGPEKYDPHTRETADHSAPYLVLATLLDGAISDSSFEPKRFRDPKILALLKNVVMEEDAAFTREWPGTFQCRIEVTGKSGRKWVRHQKNPKGHPTNPMSDLEIEAKFIDLAKGSLSDRQIRTFFELAWHLEELENVGPLFDAIVV